MGLILNLIAFRIGHLNSWSDAWFTHRMYYPVFLHNVLMIKALIFYVRSINLESIYKFYSDNIVYGKWKILGLLERKNIGIKRRMYSSQQRFTDQFEEDYKSRIKDNGFITDEDKKEVIAQFDKLKGHPLTFNTVKKEGEYVKLEVLNVTSKGKSVKIKEEKIEVVKVGENSRYEYQGTLKLVNTFRVEKEKFERGEIIVEDERYFNDVEKEELVKKQVGMINNGEGVKEIDMDNWKWMEKYEGGFTKNTSYDEFMGYK